MLTVSVFVLMSFKYFAIRASECQRLWWAQEESKMCLLGLLNGLQQQELMAVPKGDIGAVGWDTTEVQEPEAAVGKLESGFTSLEHQVNAVSKIVPMGAERGADRISPGIDAEEFVMMYLEQNKPAIFTKGLTDGWPANERWKRASLLKNYANQELLVKIKPGSAETMRLARFIYQVMPAGSRRAKPDQVPDVRSVFARVSESALADDFTIPAVLNDTEAFSMYDQTQGPDAPKEGEFDFFVGPTGTGTSLKVSHPSWHALVHGRKRWAIFNKVNFDNSFKTTRTPLQWFEQDLPEFQSSPNMYEFIQEAGEVVFVPDGWGYATLHLEPCVGVSKPMSPWAHMVPNEVWAHMDMLDGAKAAGTEAGEIGQWLSARDESVAALSIFKTANELGQTENGADAETVLSVREKFLRWLTQVSIHLATRAQFGKDPTRATLHYALCMLASADEHAVDQLKTHRDPNYKSKRLNNPWITKLPSGDMQMTPFWFEAAPLRCMLSIEGLMYQRDIVSGTLQLSAKPVEHGQCDAEKGCAAVAHNPEATGGFAMTERQRESLNKLLPVPTNQPKIDYISPDVEPKEFYEKYVVTNRPAIIKKGMLDTWKAHTYWTKAEMLKRYPDVTVETWLKPYAVTQATGEDHGQKMNMTLKDYIEKHMEHTNDPESPALDFRYIFGQSYPEGALGDAFDLPAIFEYTHTALHKAARENVGVPPPNSEHGPGVFEMIMGPAGSGAHLHAHKRAWNGLVFGRKRWIMVSANVFDRDFSQGANAYEWFEKAYPLMKDDPNVYEFIQEPGEVVWVPQGWSHATLNLEP